MYSGHSLRTPNHVGLVGLIAIVATFVAHAQEPTPSEPTVPDATAPLAVEPEPVVPPPAPLLVPASAPSIAQQGSALQAMSSSLEAAKSIPSKKKPGYRGSALTYGHQATAYTFDKAAQNTYNPTWSHRLGIVPEWHFNDQLYVRGSLYLAQEFALQVGERIFTSDSTSHRNEVELSDLMLEAGASGWTEPFTRIRLGASLRVGLPTSKISRAATRVLALGPAAFVSRTFGWFTVGYSGHYAYRFHRFTAGQLESPSIADCGNPLSSACAEFEVLGSRNAHSDVTHGPLIAFAPFQRVSANASFQFTYLYLYPLTAVAGVAPPEKDTTVRSLTGFDLSVTVQIFKPVALTFGTATFSPQLDSFGKRNNPLFNRNTTLYLDAAFDIEAAVSGLFGEST